MADSITKRVEAAFAAEINAQLATAGITDATVYTWHTPVKLERAGPAVWTSFGADVPLGQDASGEQRIGITVQGSVAVTTVYADDRDHARCAALYAAVRAAVTAANAGNVTWRTTELSGLTLAVAQIVSGPPPEIADGMNVQEIGLTVLVDGQ